MNCFERATTVFCAVVLWASMAVIFMILVCNTALRYATGDSLQWANEVPELLFPWMVMAGVVLAALRGAHITTQFLLDVLPAGLQRVVTLAGCLLVAALYATLVWSTWGMLDIVHDERSQILGIPGSVTYVCVMGGMTLLALLALQSALRVARPQQPVQPGRDEQAAPHW